MRILITGVCGFAGSVLAEQLMERVESARVFGVDNLMRPGAETNRTRLEKLGVGFIHGDLRCASDLEGLPASDWVIDAAANPSVLAGLAGAGSSRRLIEHNVLALGNVLEYCRTHRAGLLLLSSSRVYSIQALNAIPLRIHDRAFTVDPAGPLPEGVSRNGISEGASTTPPLSLYGATKLSSEVLALEYGHAFDFPVWVTRCGVLAGAGQFGTPSQGIFAYWLNAHLRRRPLRYVGFGGTGHQVRDALHPADLAGLLIAQMRTSRRDGQRLYTVGGGPDNAISLAQLTAWCDDRFGPHMPSADPALRAYDVPWVAMDGAAAARDFGWRPERTIWSILGDIASHADRHPDWLELSNA